VASLTTGQLNATRVWSSFAHSGRMSVTRRMHRTASLHITPVKLETGCYPDSDGRNKGGAMMKEAKPEGSYSPQGHWCSSEARR
jgi:hypothetical protein